jgi:hypothetical protein
MVNETNEAAKANENARKTLAAEREITDRSRAEFVEKTRGRPTPTQEENDLAMLGGTFVEHEDDGSGPDPNIVKSLEGRPAAPYQTRAAAPQQHRPVAPTSTASTKRE